MVAPAKGRKKRFMYSKEFQLFRLFFAEVSQRKLLRKIFFFSLIAKRGRESSSPSLLQVMDFLFKFHSKLSARWWWLPTNLCSNLIIRDISRYSAENYQRTRDFYFQEWISHEIGIIKCSSLKIIFLVANLGNKISKPSQRHLKAKNSDESLRIACTSQKITRWC